MTAFSILLFCLLLLLVPLDAYRRGDVVDTVLLTKDASASTTILQKDMPLFGVSSTSVVKKVSSPMFSLGFEDGLYMLPWIRNERLNKLVITFTYSKEGSIHSVSSRVVNIMDRRGGDDSFDIEYQWIEEAPLDVKSGISIMFLVTLVISIIFLIQTCDTTTSIEDDDDYDDPSRRRRGQHRE